MSPRFHRPSRRRLASAALAISVAFIFVFGARIDGRGPGSTAEAAPRSVTWQLVDNHQAICFTTRSNIGYFGIWIKGKWSRTVNVGISGLPSGGTFTTSYAPIASGAGSGQRSLAYVAARLPASTPIGSYTASLWASDGRSRQTVPVTLNVKTKCMAY
jgi:hypothetical protein